MRRKEKIIKKHKYMINFDFDTVKLKENNQDYRKIYNILSKELSKEFNHIQWSGYISKQEISRTKINLLLKNLAVTYPNYFNCLRNISITIVEHDYDYTLILKEAAITAINKEKKDNLINSSKYCENRKYNFNKDKGEE